ncbi:phosphotransferase [Marimonas lutisalis]|uniref:phosphotransferase n=1 Tax=Marimonas lutisalis TaxID=2545756 RepID=UPI0010F74A05|nr:phosphotransferase [Marimonas lutisalis]
MNILDQDNLHLYPDQALAALNQLEAAIARAGLDAQVDQALRLVPGKRAVFQGRLSGAEVVFRLPLDDANRADFVTEWAELSRARGHMNTGRNRVAEPLHFDRDTGLSVIAHIPGTPLLTHLWTLEAADRLPLLSRAADWLHAYMEPTLEWRGINRRPWRNWAAAAAEKQTHPELIEIERRILQKMHQLSRKLGDPEWRVAIPHGDFHLNNLILDGDRLTGIDTGGSNHAPIYKDMARALTHIARRGMLPSGRRRFGVDEGALATFAAAFELTEREQNAFLPYMITFEALIKVEHPDMSADRVQHAVEMSQALFQDLRQIS